MSVKILPAQQVLGIRVEVPKDVLDDTKLQLKKIQDLYSGKTKLIKKSQPSVQPRPAARAARAAQSEDTESLLEERHSSERKGSQVTEEWLSKSEQERFFDAIFIPAVKVKSNVLYYWGTEKTPMQTPTKSTKQMEKYGKEFDALIAKCLAKNKISRNFKDSLDIGVNQLLAKLQESNSLPANLENTVNGWVSDKGLYSLPSIRGERKTRPVLNKSFDEQTYTEQMNTTMLACYKEYAKIGDGFNELEEAMMAEVKNQPTEQLQNSMKEVLEICNQFQEFSAGLDDMVKKNARVSGASGLRGKVKQVNGYLKIFEKLEEEITKITHAGLFGKKKAYLLSEVRASLNQSAKLIEEAAKLLKNPSSNSKAQENAVKSMVGYIASLEDKYENNRSLNKENVSVSITRLSKATDKVNQKLIGLIEKYDEIEGKIGKIMVKVDAYRSLGKLMTAIMILSVVRSLGNIIPVIKPFTDLAIGVNEILSMYYTRNLYAVR